MHTGGCCTEACGGKQMKIALVSGLFAPHSRGGAERVVEEESAGLNALGHQVHVVTAVPWSQAGFKVVQSVEAGVHVCRLFVPNLFFYNEMGKYGAARRSLWHGLDIVNVIAAARLAKLLYRIDPDVVHTHNLKGFGFLVPAMLRHTRFRHVHTVHDVQLVEPSGLILPGQEADTSVRRAYSVVTRSLFGSPDVLISPSRFLMSFYEQRDFFGKSLRAVLPNPTQDGHPLDRAERKGTRFLFLGQCEPHKGIALLLKAFEDTRTIKRDFTLTFAGDGSLLSAVKQAADNDSRIEVLGRISPTRIAEVMSRVDFSIVPSICFENTPTAVTESLSNAVPVLASDSPGTAEHVEHGVNGFVFKCNRADALKDAMLLASTADWKRLSQRAVQSTKMQRRDVHCEALADLYARAGV
jgi:glycosyltransferase involved in cell wall biosynthesis